MAGSAILDSRGHPMADSVTSAIQATTPFNPLQQRESAMSYLFAPQLAFAAYLASGLLQKVIDIPAADRVREWRDWQADKEVIEQIETEERRLGLIAKVKQAEVLRGIGGGALILAAPGDPATPIPSLGKGALAAINVVSRWQLTGENYVTELTDPAYGTPRMWSMSSDRGQARIHPSRVIAFRGDPLPAGYGVSGDALFWGQSRLVRVWRDVERSDQAQGWFAALVKKAKLLRIGIPGLTDFTATPAGQAKLDGRIAALALGESVLNATVYDSGSGDKGAGEQITDYQVNWSGIPAMMDAFDQRVAAVADIPFTRLMGRSPAGMNATGEYDDANWNKTVAAGQSLELRPCLEALDPMLLASAGVSAPGKVTWRFAPLSKPSEKQEADTFKIIMEAVTALQNTGAIPDVAFAKGVQNLMAEREYIPGLDQALAEIPENERFGLTPDDDGTDPSDLQAGKEGDPTSADPSGEDGSQTARRRAANDTKPRTLYVSRKVQNAADLRAWAREQGMPTLQDDLHVTIAYSTTPVDWIAMGATWADASGKEAGDLVITAGGPRVIEPLGNRTAVLMFASSDLSWRNREMREAGASWDFPDYQPHISLTGEPVDLATVEPYRGKIVLGPEVFEEIDTTREA